MFGYFYELKCDVFHTGEYFTYYYFYSPRAIHSPAMAMRNGYAPDAVRILIKECGEKPCKIRVMHNVFEYIYKKYSNTIIFPDGFRANWEKEIKSF